MPLLESLARLPAKGGKPGKLLPPLPPLPEQGAELALGPQLAVDPYRRDLPRAVARQDIWPWLVLAASCLFLADVFVRRVQIGFEWLAPVWERFAELVLRRERAVATPETMARLRSRKAEVTQSIESRRAAARFEPDERAGASSPPIDADALAAAEAKPTSPGGQPAVVTKPAAPAEEVPDDYTSRLLKAKKQVWKDRGTDRGFDPDTKDSN